MTFLYNDAYLHVLGAGQTRAPLGRPASEVWAEIWDVCGPLADKVLRRARPASSDDVRLFMNRGDFLEETFYSFSYSPIRDESGQVCGLFCPSTDVTPKVVNTRRIRTLSELATNALAEKTTVGRLCHGGPHAEPESGRYSVCAAVPGGRRRARAFARTDRRLLAPGRLVEKDRSDTGAPKRHPGRWLMSYGPPSGDIVSRSRRRRACRSPSRGSRLAGGRPAGHFTRRA